MSRFLDKVKYRPVIRINRSMSGKILGSYVVGKEWRVFSRIAFMHPLTSLFVTFSVILSLCSAFLGFGELFARSGALLVCSAVFLEFHAISSIRSEALRLALEEVVKEIEERHDNAIVEQLAGWDENKDPRVFRGEPRVPVSAVKILNLKERPFVRIEIALAAIGTVIWSFGDWGICSVETWSLSTC